MTPTTPDELQRLRRVLTEDRRRQQEGLEQERREYAEVPLGRGLRWHLGSSWGLRVRARARG
jgi:hypothetical protein